MRPGARDEGRRAARAGDRARDADGDVAGALGAVPGAGADRSARRALPLLRASDRPGAMHPILVGRAAIGRLGRWIGGARGRIERAGARLVGSLAALIGIAVADVRPTPRPDPVVRDGTRRAEATTVGRRGEAGPGAAAARGAEPRATPAAGRPLARRLAEAEAGNARDRRKPGVAVSAAATMWIDRARRGGGEG